MENRRPLDARQFGLHQLECTVATVHEEVAPPLTADIALTAESRDLEQIEPAVVVEIGQHAVAEVEQMVFEGEPFRTFRLGNRTSRGRLIAAAIRRHRTAPKLMPLIHEPVQWAKADLVGGVRKTESTLVVRRTHEVEVAVAVDIADRDLAAGVGARIVHAHRHRAVFELIPCALAEEEIGVVPRCDG